MRLQTPGQPDDPGFEEPGPLGKAKRRYTHSNTNKPDYLRRLEQQTPLLTNVSRKRHLPMPHSYAATRR